MNRFYSQQVPAAGTQHYPSLVSNLNTTWTLSISCRTSCWILLIKSSQKSERRSVCDPDHLSAATWVGGARCQVSVLSHRGDKTVPSACLWKTRRWDTECSCSLLNGLPEGVMGNQHRLQEVHPPYLSHPRDTWETTSQRKQLLQLTPSTDQLLVRLFWNQLKYWTSVQIRMQINMWSVYKLHIVAALWQCSDSS